MRQFINLPRFQKGLTLISLMVGSMVSIIVLLAGVTFYKNHIQATTGVVQMSSYAANLSFVLNFIEVEVSSAGFGFVEGVNVYDKRAVDINVQDDFQDLYWALDKNIDPGDEDMDCAGLRERRSVDDETNFQYITLYYLKPASACTEGQELAGIQWTEVEPIAVFESKDVHTYLVSDDHDFIFSFELKNDEHCMPFGLSDTDITTRSKLKVTGFYPTGLTKAVPDPIDQFVFDVCLANVRSTPV